MPLALVRLDPDGRAQYTFHRPFREAYRPEPDLGGVFAFHFGSLFALDPRTAPGVEALLEAGRRAGALLSYDPNLCAAPTRKERRRIWAYLEGVDLLKLSLEDAGLLFQDPWREVPAP